MKRDECEFDFKCSTPLITDIENLTVERKEERLVLFLYFYMQDKTRSYIELDMYTPFTHMLCKWCMHIKFSSYLDNLLIIQCVNIEYFTGVLYKSK